MTDLTEQQEQEMFERAKAGDPEANYNMSLWALEQAMAEPDEERWNRLAAKCLVKAAEAGYAPAQAKMDELLNQTSAAAEPASDTSYDETPAASSEADDYYNDDDDEDDDLDDEDGDVPIAAPNVGALFGKVKGLFSRPAAFSRDSEPAEDGSDEDEDSDVKVATGDNRRSTGKGGLFDFSKWEPSRWKTIQTICIIICAVLVILIVSMVIRGHKDGGGSAAEPDEQVQIPVAASIAPEATTTPIPTTEPAETIYPTQAIRDEIAASSLDAFPSETDYVDKATTVTVATESGPLNVRSGPATTYTQVTTVNKDDVLDVYAYKNGWALIKTGSTWGWCSKDYLK